MLFKRKLYQKLLKWKEISAGSSALLIEGARRIGKSTIVEEFAKAEYKSYLLIDFNRVGDEVKDLFLHYLNDLDTLFMYLSGYYNVKLYEHESLIIFDEVQMFPRARAAIKYLVADGRYDYLETGSLMSSRKNVKDIVIPSEERHIKMYPMDFEEFLWAMGNDTLMDIVRKRFEAHKSMGQVMHRKAMDYFRQYPWVRRDEETYHKLTFSMMYFPNEYYLLPLSHDENVHGKATVMQKMFGEYEQKFPQARLLYLYMYAHPGKKLLFMGSELGQLREWTEEEQQDWDILKYPIHDAFYHFMLELNKLYLTEPALYRDDYERNGFCWVDCHQEQKGIYAMERRSGDSRILILLHMSDEATQNYTFTLPDCGGLKPLLHTDWERFHGSVKESKRTITGDTTRTGMQFTLELPPFSGIMLRILPEKPKQTTAKPAAKRKTAAGRKTTK